MAEEDLQEILEFAIEIAKEAGRMMKEGQQRMFASDAVATKEKLNSVDLVTEVDVAVEKFLFQQIGDRYPNHKLIGEESYTGQEITDEPTWIIDPVDGTSNFVHGFPFTCTSIGLTINKVPVVGVIYNPFLDQLYSGAKGLGSHMNGRKLPLSNRPLPLQSLGKALIGIEYGSSRGQAVLGSKTNTFLTLAGDPSNGVKNGKMAHSMRSLGSAACNIAMVATGGLDIYWEIGCWPWDVCAGAVILQEAGGAFFGSKHGPLTGEVTPEVLVGRKYLFFRGIADEEGGETGKEAQIRLAKEFYETVEEYDP